MKITIAKQLDNSFKIVYDSDFESLRKMPVGREYEVEIKNRRNYKFHKKFFALINLVYQNQEHYNNLNHLRSDLIKASGFYEERTSFDGELITEAKSIKFSKMDEIEFNDLYNRVIDTVVKYFNFDKELIIDNVNKHF